jgi:ferredoxin-NADP reductase
MLCSTCQGCLDLTLRLAGLVQNMDAHYFLCGPVQFMAEIQTSLEQQDVLADQIHFETFGPVG